MQIFKGIGANRIKELSELLKRTESVQRKLEKALRDEDLMKAKMRANKTKRRQLPWKKGNLD